MKSLLLRLIDRLGSLLIALGAVVSVLCLVTAAWAVFGGMSLQAPTPTGGEAEQEAGHIASTVVLEQEGAFEPTPEPMPSVYLPPLVLPTRTPEPDILAQELAAAPGGQGEPALGQGGEALYSGNTPEPAPSPSEKQTFSQWLGSLFKPRPSQPPQNAPTPNPTQPKPTQPPAAPIAQAPPPSPKPPAPNPPAPQPRGDIAALLASLPIQGEDTRAKYARNEFGKGWTSDSRGCRTRHVILERDLTNIHYEHKCKVSSGTLADPYTGKTINFVAGPDTSDDVQIDHVVALRDAWGTGAQNLDKERRIHFANDPLNLLAVDGPTNNQKGHKNAAAWLPPNQAFRCHYVARQIAVKARYRLWASQPEHDALARELAACPAGMRVHGNTIEGA